MDSFDEITNSLVKPRTNLPMRAFFEEPDFWTKLNRTSNPLDSFTALVHKYAVYSDNGEIVLELALPGYDREDLEVYDNDGVLTIKTVDNFSTKLKETEESKTYYFRTLQLSPFCYNFSLKNSSKVKLCDMENGVLRITLMQEPPTAKNAANLLRDNDQKIFGDNTEEVW